jgi:hypothetical protein
LFRNVLDALWLATKPLISITKAVLEGGDIFTNAPNRKGRETARPSPQTLRGRR